MAAVASGAVAPGLEPVREAFVRNLDGGGDVGAAFAVVRGDEVLVDLWGGVADPETGRPWAHDTPALTFSCTKGVVAVAALRLVERGELDLDAPVARYWPAYGAAGKAGTLVREALAHLAGQPVFRTPVTLEQLPDDAAMEAVIAAEEPWWEPGAAVAYHSVTFGPIVGGLLRAVTGASVGTLIREQIAGPLGLDLWLGLPAERLGSVARLVAPAPLVPSAEPSNPLAYAALNHPPLFSHEGLDALNSDAYRGAELPAASLIATATALAATYAALIDGSGRLLRPETVALGCRTISEGDDRLGGEARRFGVGWQLWRPGSRLGDDERAFGHGGAGGALSGAWPSRGVGFAYVPNALYADERYESRADALLRALADALDAAG